MPGRLIRMSAGVVLLFLAMTLAAEPTTAPAGDLVGDWKWTLQVQGNTIPWTAKFSKTGDKYTGTAIDGYDETKLDFTNIKVEGGTVSFDCERTGDFHIFFVHSGKLSADGITGTVKVQFGENDPQDLPWKASREKETATTMPTTQPAK